MLVITIEAKESHLLTQDAVREHINGIDGCEYRFAVNGRILEAMVDFIETNQCVRWFEFCNEDQSAISDASDTLSGLKWELNLNEAERTLNARTRLVFCIIPKSESDWPNKDSFFNYFMSQFPSIAQRNGVELTRVVERTPDLVRYSK